MADCELLGDGCGFFREGVIHDLTLAECYTRRYCRGYKEICARYMVYTALGPGTVPSGLFPNDQDIAAGIIEGEKRVEAA